MSSNSSASCGNAPQPNQSSIPPEISLAIVEGFATAIRPAVVFTMIHTILASMLIPIILALFFFSTRESRRRLIFILNVLSLSLAVALAVWNGVNELTAITNPAKVLPSAAFFGFGLLLQLSPLLSELVLILRILAVFPQSRTSKPKLASVLAPTLAFKTVRIICLAFFFNQYIPHIRGIGNAVEATAGDDVAQLTWTRVTIFTELADNSYMSGIFIWKLYHSNVLDTSQNHRVSFHSKDSFGSKVRVLFWIAVTNFVFPVLFNITELIVIYRVPTKNNFDFEYIYTVDYYVTVVAVVFATLWSTSTSFKTNLSRKDSQSVFTWNAHTGQPNDDRHRRYSVRAGGVAVCSTPSKSSKSEAWDEDVQSDLYNLHAIPLSKLEDVNSSVQA